MCGSCIRVMMKMRTGGEEKEEGRGGAVAAQHVGKPNFTTKRFKSDRRF